MMLKQIISGVLVLAVTVGSVSAAAEGGASSWAREEIEEAIALELIPDELQSSYDQPITRGEFAQMAVYFLAVQYNYRPSDMTRPFEFLEDYASYHRDAEGEGIDRTELPLKREPYAKDPESWAWSSVFAKLDEFDDLTSVSMEQVTIINAAYLFGLVRGKGEGKYDPDGLITRQEAAVILERTYRVLSGQPELEYEYDLTAFVDQGAIADWARNGAAFAVGSQVMQGVGGQSFDPLGSYTREQCAVTFLRLYQNGAVSKANGNVPPLLPYEEDLERALQTGYAWTNITLSAQVEVDGGTVIYASHGGLPHGVVARIFVIVYRSGGHKWITMPSEFTDSLSYLSDFMASESDGRVYCTGSTNSYPEWTQRYYIDFETARLVPVE